MKDGADRFLGMSKGGERPYARIYTRVGNPTTEYIGSTPSPFDAWLNSCFLQDLPVRQKEMCATAARIAEFLRRHPKVEQTTFPGFADFAQADIVRKQMRLPGALISFELRGGFCGGETMMKYFARKDVPMELAVSLGATISYIQHRASMTHAVVPEADRRSRGITPGLVRLSVGLEGPETLIEHLDRALALS